MPTRRQVRVGKLMRAVKPMALMRAVKTVVLAVSLLAYGTVCAEPSLTGQTGLIYMPDARVDPDGTWRSGYSFTDPYRAIWTSLTAMPRLEASFRYTEIDGAPSGLGDDFGDFKDKAFDLKIILAEEGRWWPALGVGAQDIGQGTGLFRANYLTASKRIYDFDFTVGYGDQRIDGVFGGVRYSPRWLPNWSLVAEYDANDYPNDPFATLTGVNKRDKDVVAGIEYRYRWVGLQASYGHDEVGVNAYLAIPLQEQWIPKINEPPPYVEVTPRPSLAQWQSDSTHEGRMLSALLRQDFKDVRISVEHYRVTVVLTNTRISEMSRAVGRAARTVLNLSPVETREIRIVYTVADMPFATYTFIDVRKLERYFNGMIGRPELSDYVIVEYSDPADNDVAAATEDVLAAIEEEQHGATKFFDRTEGDLLSIRTESTTLDRFKISPQFSLYLNDPSGAYKYDLYLRAQYDRKLARKTFFTGAVRGTLVENVSDVTQPSNSLLPNVRTDIANYFQERGVKLERLLLNRFFNPRERVYARASAGVYELMFSGVGGQVLYVPQRARWATDLSVDWVRKRDYDGGFGHLDYETVTALGAVHYRMPYYGLTTTVRAGRFLAKDVGARFEIKRRFRSGFEMGAWYTITDGDDITSPGSPDNPYYDKGIFAVIPFNALLTRDTQAKARASLAPWTRDVGQMVKSPADLYEILEDELRNKNSQDSLVRLGDLVDDPFTPPPPNAVRESVNWDAFGYYIGEGTNSIFSNRTFWWGLGSLAVIGASYALDDEVDDQVRDNKNDTVNQNFGDLGKVVAVGSVGLSGLAALDRDDTRLSRTGVTALQSALLGLGTSAMLNYAVGRAKPELGLGKDDFDSGRDRDLTSFPSDLTTVAWATITPYAKEYDAPWLYGVAALTNVGRIAERRHWLSDTVAASFLGWGIGTLMWELNSKRARNMPMVTVTPQSVHATWTY